MNSLSVRCLGTLTQTPSTMTARMCVCACVCMCVSLQSLWDATDCSLPGSSSSVRGILQARKLELPFPSLGDLPDPGIKPGAPAASPALQADSLQLSHPGSPQIVYIWQDSWSSKQMLEQTDTLPHRRIVSQGRQTLKRFQQKIT